MKKHSKIILIISACAVALGLLLAGIGFINGANLWMRIDSTGAHVVETQKHTLSDLQLEPFTSIRVDTQEYDIRFIESEQFGVEFIYHDAQYPPSYTAEDATLTITSQKKERGSAFYVNFNFSFQFQKDKLNIYLPSGCQLEDVQINNDNGEINIGNFSAKNTVIRSEYGSVSLHDFSAESLDVQMQSGKSEIKNGMTKKLSFQNEYGESRFENVNDVQSEQVEIKAGNGKVSLINLVTQNLVYHNAYGKSEVIDCTIESLRADVENGDFTLEDSVLQQANINSQYGQITAKGLTANGLTIQSENGNIDLDGLFTGETNIDSKYGKVHWSTATPSVQYNASCSTEYGTIRIDGEKYEDNYKQNNSASNSITVKSQNGNVELRFSGESESTAS